MRSERRRTERSKERRRIALLWLGILGPALAWSMQLVAGDALTELGCERGLGVGGVRAGVIVLTIAAVGVALTTGVAGFRQRVQAADERRGERTAFLALCGAASTAIFVAVIVA